MLNLITRYINKCEICMLAKYDRKPVNHAFNITATPCQFNDIVHMDIWFPMRNVMYLSFIDKFSKHTSSQVKGQNMGFYSEMSEV